ncbi:MAG: hypothetical protein HUK02_01035 [Bacteroidaceae bacterium]|nr:hypothetical protein [Bacteroidaceae bacterium]
MKQLFSIFSLVALFSLPLSAQVQVQATIDSLQLFVGQQTGITLEVACGAQQRVEMPVFQPNQELLPNVEVVRIEAADTTMLDEGKRMQVKRKYIVTAWDSAFYYLPPMEVMVDGKAYPTKSLALKVYTMDVDTVHVDRYCPPKAEMPLLFSWDDWRGVIWCAVIALLLIACAVVLIYSLRTGKPIIRIVRKKKKEPAHELAIQEIEKIKYERVWAQEDSKEYYTRLTDTLRTYIQERYGFSAMEMTSSEIIERLNVENDEDALKELRSLFTTADLVKFAKYSTLINENDANLVTALTYINQTKLEADPNEKTEEVIITPEQKRQLATIWAMRVTIAVASVVAVCLLGWVIYRVFDLLR